MADYIYLLQTKLNVAQQSALATVRNIAKAHGMTVFLVGGAVRDLTSGAPVRDLDVVVQGSAFALRKEIGSHATIIGESKQLDALYLNMPGGVRMEVSSALTVSYPKPGKPVVEHASILDDLRRRDFTANAMAISLNEGSYGLLMDPLNGIADIENMELRLVSNYGFIEDPVRMIRAARLGARLGWHLEEKTQQRYNTGKEEGYISAMSPFQQGYETEEIFHEEDPIGVLKHLEAEGWSKYLFPAWTSSKINETELNRLRDIVGQLELAGIQPDPSPAYFPVLTARLSPKDLQNLTASFPRIGFVEQANKLDSEIKAFAVQFSGKAGAAPSEAWKLLKAAPPEQVLWLAYSSKSAPVQAKFKAFFTEWPQARNRIPYQLMQEMRITPEIPGYAELLEQLFFAIMDGKLDSPEAARAFLEPFSPPAPPPPVNLRRKAVKRESKVPKSRKKEKVESVEAPATELAATPAASTPPSPETTVEGSEPAAPREAKQKKALSKAQPAKVIAKDMTSKKSLPAKTAAKQPIKQTPKKAAQKPVKAPKKGIPAKKSVAVKKGSSKPIAVKKVASKAPAKKSAPKKQVTQGKTKTKKAASKKVALKAKKQSRR